MARKNYLIDGVSCAGKTTVGRELQRRGFQVVHGDDELAFWADPVTGRPAPTDSTDRDWYWNLDRLQILLDDREPEFGFFCGGARNGPAFRSWFDGAFVLEIDFPTLEARLALRPPTEWGGTAAEGEAFARRQWKTREGFPARAVSIDASQPLDEVVRSILSAL